MKKKRGKKKFSLKEQYELSWNFLKESGKFFYFTILLFFVFVFIGYFVPAPIEVQDVIKDYIKQLLLETEGMNSFELIKFIFLNNLQVSFFGVVLGVLFGIFPLIYTIGNGYILGFVSSIAVREGGLGILLRLLPHGIFELPAVFISLSLGFKLASFVLQTNKSEAFRKYFWNSLRVFVFIVIPLLVIAAIIEGSLI
ncbi:MAG: stage II sporulation protein M [Candidatus Pacearchaeota archaeon]|jgi:stage II sporulation protein M